MEEFNAKFLQDARALGEELASWRRDLHRHPELSFDLTYTKAFVKERLTEMGCEPVDCGRSGVVVVLGKGGGKTVLIRGQYGPPPHQGAAGGALRPEAHGEDEPSRPHFHHGHLPGRGQPPKTV